jgi:diguanylate cyclase (GGDEF)-like protein
VPPLVRAGLLAGWKVQEARSFEYARSVQQRDPCDVVLIEASSSQQEQLAGLAESIGSWDTPVVVLADQAARVVQTDPESAWQHWLPRDLIATHPPLLELLLQQAAELSDLQRESRMRRLILRDCQRQVDRLVELLSPRFQDESGPSWFGQRHMMERLYEEVTRSQRHGDALTVVLGELADSPAQMIDAIEPSHLISWASTQIARCKRRCDVAGQYGPHGFILLLPHTSDEGGVRCCRRLQPLLESHADLPAGARGPLQVCFGIASYSPETNSVKGLLGRAEERLERARGLVGDCLVF